MDHVVTLPTDGLGDSPDGTARSFLVALDERRWHDAAALVDPQTAERFRGFWLARLESEAADDVPDDVLSDTRFISATGLLHVPDAASAAQLTAAEILARVAEALHPDNVLRRAGAPAGEGAIRVTRTLIDSVPPPPEGTRVRYRMEWRQGKTVSDRGVHTLELTRTSAGWAIRDADLGGHGGGAHRTPIEPVGRGGVILPVPGAHRTSTTENPPLRQHSRPDWHGARGTPPAYTRRRPTSLDTADAGAIIPPALALTEGEC